MTNICTGLGYNRFELKDKTYYEIQILNALAIEREKYIAEKIESKSRR